MKYLFLKRKGLLSLVLNKQEIVQDKLSGVGFKSTKDMAKSMSPIRNDVELFVEEYKELKPRWRNESKESFVKFSNDKKHARIIIADSKEAWVSSLMIYFDILTNEKYDDIETISVNFDNIRPKGERLKTFGGFASGYEPMRDMFVGVDNTLKNRLEKGSKPLEKVKGKEGYAQVRPVHVLDIGNLIANNVVSGGVRRSAEIFLFDSNDYESMLAKYGINGIWTQEQLDNHNKLGKVLEGKGVKPTWFDELTEYTEWKFAQIPKQMELNSEKVRLETIIEHLEDKGEGIKSVLTKDKGSFETKREELTLESLFGEDSYGGIEGNIQVLKEKVKVKLEGILDEIKDLDEDIMERNPRKGLGHRNMSNNSVGFTTKPKKEDLNLIFELMKLDGEPKQSWAL